MFDAPGEITGTQGAIRGLDPENAPGADGETSKYGALCDTGAHGTPTASSSGTRGTSFDLPNPVHPANKQRKGGDNRAVISNSQNKKPVLPRDLPKKIRRHLNRCKEIPHKLLASLDGEEMRLNMQLLNSNSSDEELVFDAGESSRR